MYKSTARHSYIRADAGHTRRHALRWTARRTDVHDLGKGGIDSELVSNLLLMPMFTTHHYCLLCYIPLLRD